MHLYVVKILPEIGSFCLTFQGRKSEIFTSTSWLTAAHVVKSGRVGDIRVNDKNAKNMRGLVKTHHVSSAICGLKFINILRYVQDPPKFELYAIHVSCVTLIQAHDQ